MTAPSGTSEAWSLLFSLQVPGVDQPVLGLSVAHDAAILPRSWGVDDALQQMASEKRSGELLVQGPTAGRGVLEIRGTLPDPEGVHRLLGLALGRPLGPGDPVPVLASEEVPFPLALCDHGGVLVEVEGTVDAAGDVRLRGSFPEIPGALLTRDGAIVAMLVHDSASGWVGQRIRPEIVEAFRGSVVVVEPDGPVGTGGLGGPRDGEGPAGPHEGEGGLGSGAPSEGERGDPPASMAPLVSRLLSDVAEGDDALDVEGEAMALAQLVAARSLRPPLSIGLFGEWGAGKSFFIRELKRQLLAVRDAARAGHAEAQDYCRNIVTIDFNAWHFIDRDLWASLASEVFRQLDDRLERGDVLPGRNDPSTEAERRQLLEDRTAKEDRLAGFLRQRERLELQNASSLAAVRRLSARIDAEWRRAIPTLRRRVADEKVAAALGLQEEELERLMDDAGALGRWAAALRAARRRGELGFGRLLWPGLGLVALGFAAFWLTSRVMEALGPSIAAWWEPVAELAAGALPLAVALWRRLEPYRKAAAEARRVVEETRTSAPVVALESERDLIEKKAEETREEIRRIDDRLSALGADRRLARFISRTRDEGAYREYLGAVARAREDFRTLSELFGRAAAEAGSAEEADDFPKIDRIVLFIDDLDRCPEEKVFEVLQAVHLLLAFELFVVVTAVDPRWLVHSLERSAPVLRAGRDADGDDVVGDDSRRGHATPTNYLEKIFQIPFRVRSMDDDGYQSLLWRIVRDRARPPEWTPRPRGDPALAPGGEPGAPEAAASGGDPGPDTGGRPGDADAAAGAAGGPADSAGARGADGAGEGVDGARTGGGAGGTRLPLPLVPAAALFEMDDDELWCMERLYPVVPNPRAAKRLVNVYRLARVLDSRRDGWASPPTEWKQALIVLLAAMIGYPGAGVAFVEGLATGSAEGLLGPRLESWSGHDTADDPAVPMDQALGPVLRELGLEGLDGATVRRAARLAVRFSLPMAVVPGSDQDQDPRPPTGRSSPAGTRS